MDNFYKQHFYY